MKKIFLFTLTFSFLAFSKGYVETYGDINVVDNGMTKINETGLKIEAKDKGLKISTKIGLDNGYISLPDQSLYKSYEDYSSYLYKDYTYIGKNLLKNLNKTSNVYIEYKTPNYQNIETKFKVGIAGEYRDFKELQKAFVEADAGYKFKNSKVGLITNLPYYINQNNKFAIKETIYLKAQASKVKDIDANVNIDYVKDNSDSENLILNFNLGSKFVINKYLTLDTRVKTDLKLLKFNWNGKKFKFSAFKEIRDGRQILDEDEFEYFYLLGDFFDGSIMPLHFLSNPEVDFRWFPRSIVQMNSSMNYSKDNFNICVKPFLNIFLQIPQYIGEAPIKTAESGGVNLDINKTFSEWKIGSNLDYTGYLNKFDASNTNRNTFHIEIYTSYNIFVNNKMIITPSANLKYKYTNTYTELSLSNSEPSIVATHKFNKIYFNLGLGVQYKITDNIDISSLIEGGVRYMNGKIICYKYYPQSNEKIVKYKFEKGEMQPKEEGGYFEDFKVSNLPNLKKYLRLKFNIKYSWY